MAQAAIERTGLHTPCQIWQGPDRKMIPVANHQYYDDSYDEFDEFDFIVSGITPTGELIDSGEDLDFMEYEDYKVIDFGMVDDLILRGWGYLFPTLDAE